VQRFSLGIGTKYEDCESNVVANVQRPSVCQLKLNMDWWINRIIMLASCRSRSANLQNCNIYAEILTKLDMQFMLRCLLWPNFCCPSITTIASFWAQMRPFSLASMQRLCRYFVSKQHFCLLQIGVLVSVYLSDLHLMPTKKFYLIDSWRQTFLSLESIAQC
jgi:hypothetical protein